MSHDAAPSPLLHAHWSRVDKSVMETFSAEEWAMLARQRDEYQRQEQGRQALRLLAASEPDATFGYPVNNFRHCLQAATRAWRDGCDEETVVVSLLHDIGFIVCPQSHGAFAAALMGSYISERNHWMLEHHALFLDAHAATDARLDPRARERWQGHPHFEWTARFVERYDQVSLDPAYECAPLSFFEPMVMRVFSRAPRPRLIA
jgi:predicted HD phosphohydrolase